MTLRDRKIDREIEDSVRRAHFIVRNPMPEEPIIKVCLYVTPYYPRLRRKVVEGVLRSSCVHGSPCRRSSPRCVT
jgi:hypothetical protein